jgi:hypothetical protein
LISAEISTSANDSVLVLIGALSFGIVVGYITYRTLARTTDKAAITDLATVIGAVGGGAITTLWGPSDGSTFALYSIGLLAGMIIYVVMSLLIGGRKRFIPVLGGDEVAEG